MLTIPVGSRVRVFDLDNRPRGSGTIREADSATGKHVVELDDGRRLADRRLRHLAKKEGCPA